MASDTPSQAELRDCGCTDHAADTLKSIVVLVGLLTVLLVVVFVL